MRLRLERRSLRTNELDLIGVGSALLNFRWHVLCSSESVDL